MRSIFMLVTVASLAVGAAFAQDTKSSEPEDPGKKALPRLNYDKLNVEPALRRSRQPKATILARQPKVQTVSPRTRRNRGLKREVLRTSRS